MDEVRLRRPDRSQMAFGMYSPEDLVGEDHAVRMVWAVVQQLELSAFMEPIKARQGVAGRDATDPSLLVSLWLMASIDGIFSARELARRCERDMVYLWLLGNVTVNHRLLSNFRTDHADALDGLFTQVLRVLVGKGLVKMRRISQDGMRVRASAGASSYRRGSTLEKLKEGSSGGSSSGGKEIGGEDSQQPSPSQEEVGEEAGEDAGLTESEVEGHVKQLRELFEDEQASGALSARQKAMRERAAKDRQKRVAEAMECVKQLQDQQRKSGERMSQKQREEQQTEPRASTTDVDARRMKMADGGFRPAYNVQLSADTESRAIVGVSVSSSGTDYELDGPMRDQVRQRAEQEVKEHLVDGGYMKKESVDAAAEEGVLLYVPPKPPRNAEAHGDAFTPRPGDSDAMKALRERMGSETGKTIYKERAATIETINGDLRCRRGLRELTVRGMRKVTCVALWSALAYNVMHFGQQLLEQGG